jgi:hypothetical protein
VVATTAEISFSYTESTVGRYELVPPDDQAWFWTPEWQASIDRSIAQIDAGEGIRHDTDRDFLDALDQQ